MQPKSGLLLVTRCCGSGFAQATKLLQRLRDEGMDYELHTSRPKNALNILELHGMTIEQAKAKPHILIEDLLISCESLNDARTLEDVIGGVRKIYHEKVDGQNKEGQI